MEDNINWKFTVNGQYTTSSAYKAQFLDYIKMPHIYAIWKTWAPPKCKFFECGLQIESQREDRTIARLAPFVVEPWKLHTTS